MVRFRSQSHVTLGLIRKSSKGAGCIGSPSWNVLTGDMSLDQGESLQGRSTLRVLYCYLSSVDVVLSVLDRLLFDCPPSTVPFANDASAEGKGIWEGESRMIHWV
jgi:hypothetical protein